MTKVNITKAGSGFTAVDMEGELCNYTYKQVLKAGGFDESDYNGRKIRDDFRTVVPEQFLRNDVTIIVISAPKADNGQE